VVIPFVRINRGYSNRQRLIGGASIPQSAQGRGYSAAARRTAGIGQEVKAPDDNGFTVAYRVSARGGTVKG